MAGRINLDRELVDGLRRGSEEVFSTFFEKWSGPLFSYLMSIVRNRAAAEDLLQDVCLKVLENVVRYRHRGRFKQWLFQIAYNAAVDHVRKTGRRKSASLDNGDSWMETLPGNTAKPDEALIEVELKERLWNAVGTLPPEQQTVLHLRVREGLTFREVAEVMETSVNTALGRMHYAVSAIRSNMKEYIPEKINELR